MTDRSEIIFLDVPERGLPDRGWDCGSVRETLGRRGMRTEVRTVSDPIEVATLVRENPGQRFWPTAYSFTGCVHDTSLLDALFALRADVVAVTSRYELTSKIRFKHDLRAAGLPTPDWIVLDSPDDCLRACELFTQDDRVFFKTEYSADSEGVSAVEPDTLPEVSGFNRANRLFAERDAGTVEWTVACVTHSDAALRTATMRLEPVTRSYVDSELKHDNSQIQFSPAPPDIEAAINALVNIVVQRLRVQGTFRIDIVGETPESLTLIDFNVMPALNDTPEQVSYLPLAFYLAAGERFPEVVEHIVSTS